MRLLVWLGTVFAISLISIFLSHNHALDPVENLSLTITAPIEDNIRSVASPVNDFLSAIGDSDLRSENERLRDENEALKAQLAEQQGIMQRLEELERALEVKQERPEDQLLAASVIAQDPGGLKRQIAINRGISDGLDEGMSVLSEEGWLIGTISRVYDDFAWVRLITDPDSVVNAQVNLANQPGEGEQPQVLTPDTPATPSPSVSQDPTPTPAPPEPFVRGVAEGNLGNGVVLNLPSDADVTEGDLVVTSGLGGNYPPDLLIGEIKTITVRPQSPFTSSTLQPASDLSVLDTVLVLISFKPARLQTP